MAKITMRDGAAPQAATPSEQIVRDANFASTCTDQAGRVIGMRRLNALDKMRMFEIVGGENSRNEAFLGIATIACHVTSIDGDPVPFPRSRLQLDTLVQRLDDHGIAAVAEGLAEQFGLTEAKNPVDAAKN